MSGAGKCVGSFEWVRLVGNLFCGFILMLELSFYRPVLFHDECEVEDGFCPDLKINLSNGSIWLVVWCSIYRREE